MYDINSELTRYKKAQTYEQTKAYFEEMGFSPKKVMIVAGCSIANFTGAYFPSNITSTVPSVIKKGYRTKRLPSVISIVHNRIDVMSVYGYAKGKYAYINEEDLA